MSVTFYDKLPARSSVDELEMHYLEGMTLVRHHAFAAYNKTRSHGYAQHIIDKRFIKGDINEKQDIGVDLELRFYHDFKDKFDLVPALDCGEKVDFVGQIKGQMVWFDVTWNKSKKDYKAYLNYKYHLVVEWDKVQGKWAWFVADAKQGKFRKVR